MFLVQGKFIYVSVISNSGSDHIFKLIFIAAPTELILETLMLNDGLGHK